MLVDQLLSANQTVKRRALAKTITLLESTRTDHRAQADELLSALLPHAGQSFRIGISGVPGVGKSTLIEAFGLHLIDQGHQVAVLAVDPSSSISGGSILGDKTRMEKLSVHEKAFIRPSPSSGNLGGVTEKTREAILVCEAAGYDVVIVETVGVGQSEVAVANMTDVFVLMQLPNAGDDLQAIKKGVMEMADLVLINKADIDPDAATRAQAQITSALRLFSFHGHPDRAQIHAESDHIQAWHAQVKPISALQSQGLSELWQLLCQFRSSQQALGAWAKRRQRQSLSWMWDQIQSDLTHHFKNHAEVKTLIKQVEQKVLMGQLAPSTAARQLLRAHRS